MNGLILIDKPQGITSHDVVLRVRRDLAEPRAGHFGTLDPMATGLLVVALGKASRFFPYYSKQTKSYTGRIRLGVATDTYDAEGRPLGAEVVTGLPDEAALRGAMAAFEGDIRQVPPPYSAKKVGGQPYYKLARAGGQTPRPEVAVRVERFALVAYDGTQAEVEVTCSSGTYVRALAHDLGRALGCGAHLSGLRRTRAGEFRVEEALTLERLSGLAASGEAGRVIIPLESLLPEWPKVPLEESEVPLVRTGRPVGAGGGRLSLLASAGHTGSEATVSVRLFTPSGAFLALATLDPSANVLKPFLVIE